MNYCKYTDMDVFRRHASTLGQRPVEHGRSHHCRQGGFLPPLCTVASGNSRSVSNCLCCDRLDRPPTHHHRKQLWWFSPGVLCSTHRSCLWPPEMPCPMGGLVFCWTMDLKGSPAPHPTLPAFTKPILGSGLSVPTNADLSTRLLCQSKEAFH